MFDTLLFGLGNAMVGLGIGFLCYLAKVNIWVGALIYTGIFLMVHLHS